MTDRLNILVIMTDQQNGNAMSCVGSTDVATPHQDRLAHEGVRFDRAYVAFPLCCPSRAAMATGRWPHQIGAMTNGSSLTADDIACSTGPLMRAAGYRTGWAGKWHVPNIDMGKDAEIFGFQNVCGFSDTYLADACEAFLRQDHTQPFLLFASFDNPHNICEHGRDQVLPWGEVERDDDLPANYPNLPFNHARPAFEAKVLGDLRKGMPPQQYGFTQERWRRFRHVYFRLCEKVDVEIGRLLAVLDDTGLAENTVVIMLSDHGEHNGAHELIQKSTSYEESVRVPFIVRLPEHVRNPRGRVTEAMVNTGLDLMPTLLDFADAPIPDGLDGLSVKPVVEERDPVWRDTLFVESQMDKTDVQLRMLRTKHFKYTLFDRGQYREMLFDLQNDPGELVNLAVETRYADVLNAHRKQLHKWCLATGDTFGKHYSHAPYPVIPGVGYARAPAREGLRG
ncbi:sulfatase-like hydrolase/transferase [Ahrensia marina]|uniref:sulfatase family protein n=1 Tax=Ahrensia marina TaxID=1514904 RepID=UPI0035D0E7D3